MTRTLSAEAPAKVNLALNVVGRLPDGRHALCGIFATASLRDEVEAAEAPGLSLEVEGPPEVPRDGTNHVLRAAVALAAAAGVEARARLRLVKRIPAAAGLGGGSADAAAALRLLRDLWRLDLDDARLAEIGASVGADVPFCLAGGAAVVEGAGERVEPFRPARALDLVVAHPGFPLSTAAVFGAHRPPYRDRRADVRALAAAWAQGRLDALAAGIFNDLAPTALALRPDLARFADVVRAAGCRADVMTGSGSAWIGLADGPAAAEAAAEAIRRGTDAACFAAAATAPVYDPRR